MDYVLPSGEKTAQPHEHSTKALACFTATDLLEEDDNDPQDEGSLTPGWQLSYAEYLRTAATQAVKGVQRGNQPAPIRANAIDNHTLTSE